MKKWFKNKTYGWGWTPASKEGWIVTIGFMGAFTLCSFLFSYFLTSNPEQSNVISLVFIVIFLVLMAGLIMICYKTGEKPEWRWGPKKDQ